MSQQQHSQLPQASMVLAASGWSKLDPTDPATIAATPSNVNYAITGHESQVLTMKLNTGESLQGEPGTMMYLSNGITQRVSYEGCCSRCSAGEDCFLMNFTNNGDSSIAYAALAPNYPTAKIVPVDLSHPNVGGTLICQQGAFMASYGDVNVGVSLDCNLIRCCCSGLGLVRQKLEGSGTAFLACTGTLVQKVLQENEIILVDSDCIMAFANSCTLDLKRAGGIVGMIGGGEGIFNTSLRGPGLVIVQSMNQSTFRWALAAPKLYRR